MEYLSEYDYTIRHQPGKEAIIPDTLSRWPDYKWKVNNEHIMILKASHWSLKGSLIWGQGRVSAQRGKKIIVEFF